MTPYDIVNVINILILLLIYQYLGIYIAYDVHILWCDLAIQNVYVVL